MRRREFIKLFGAITAVWPTVAHAQEPKKIPHLCFLTFDPGTLQSRSPRFDAFFDSLRELGYVNGQTISLTIYPLKDRTSDFLISFQSVSAATPTLSP